MATRRPLVNNNVRIFFHWIELYENIFFVIHSQSVEFSADVRWANFDVKSSEFSLSIIDSWRSTSDPVDWMLSSWCDISIFEGDSPTPPSVGKLPRNEERDKSGSQECSLMPPGGEGGGECRRGVCSKELLEFSSTESRKWSTCICDGVDVMALCRKNEVLILITTYNHSKLFTIWGTSKTWYLDFCGP